MKTGTFSVAAVSLLQLAAAQPSRLHHKHPKRNGIDVKVVTNVDYVTADAADVIVYVDGHGNPESTSTIYHNQVAPTASPQVDAQPSSAAPAPVQSSPEPAPPASSPTSTSTPAAAPPMSTSPKPMPAPSSSSHAAPAYSTHPASLQSSSAPAPSQPSSAPSSGPGFGSAISYSPYNADNSCKSTSQVASDLAKVTGYEVIRLYGCDCNQVANVLAATKGKGVSLFVGIFDINQIQSEAETLISAVNKDWSRINTVSVGNELVNSGGASVGQVTSAISQAKGILKTAGYSGPVVTVDTMVAMKNNPELCKASDYCAINCHAFFDGKVTADKAGPFVANWAKMVSEAAGGKTTVITETGWPSQGQTNGAAIPSPEHQKAAIASIKQSFSSNAILYSSFNNMWKKNSGSTFGAEQYWGIMGNAPTG